MFIDSQSLGFRRKTKTLFEVQEEGKGWFSNETAYCHKQNNLQKRYYFLLHLSCLQRELSVQSCVPANTCTGTLQLSSRFRKDFLWVQESHLIFFSVSDLSLTNEETARLPLRRKL